MNVSRAAGVRLGDVATSALLGLLVPCSVMVAWMLGLHAAGFGNSAVFSGIFIFGAVGTVLLSWWLHRRRFGRRVLGFRRLRRSAWHLLWVAPAVIVSSTIVAASLGHLLGVSRAAGAGTSTVGLHLSGLATVVVTIGACVLVPLIEETIFRGLLFAWVRQRVGVVGSVGIVGLVFGLFHVEPTIMLYVIPLGMGLTAVRAWFGSVWASFAVHLCNNALVSGLALAVLS